MVPRSSAAGQGWSIESRPKVVRSGWPLAGDVRHRQPVPRPAVLAPASSRTCATSPCPPRLARPRPASPRSVPPGRPSTLGARPAWCAATVPPKRGSRHAPSTTRAPPSWDHTGRRAGPEFAASSATLATPEGRRRAPATSWARPRAPRDDGPDAVPQGPSSAGARWAAPLPVRLRGLAVRRSSRRPPTVQLDDRCVAHHDDDESLRAITEAATALAPHGAPPGPPCERVRTTPPAPDGARPSRSQAPGGRSPIHRHRDPR